MTFRLGRGSKLSRIDKPSRAYRKTIAIILVATLVAAAGFLIYPAITHQGKKNSGMPLTVTVYSIGQPASVSVSPSALSATPTKLPLPGVSINIFSSMPSSFTKRTIALNLTKMNESYNNYQVLLYNGMTGTNGVANAFLNRTTLSTIDEQWANITSSNSKFTSSFSIYADYGVAYNGSLYNYYYYNNIPYNPINQTYSNFNISITMNLSQPWSVVPLNGTVMSSVQQAAPYRLPNPPPCSPGYTYALINESTVTGDYPVSLAYLNDSSAVDEFNTAFLGIAGTFSVAFNSNTLPPTTSVNQSTRVQMSSIPSATSNNDTIDYNPGAGAGAYNPYVMAEIYIPNVTMHVTNYQVYYTYLGPGDQCETQNLGVQTTIKVASVGAFSNEQNPFYAKINNQTSMGWFIQRAFGLHQLQQVTLPAGAALSNTTVILDNATGWSSAASEEQTVVNGFSVFTALLGMAFTIMDAASAFEGASTAADVASGIEITNAALGLAAACAAAFSSISFSSTYHLAITSMILTNVLTDQGNGFTVTFYQAEQNSTITLSGSTYNVNMPQTYYYVTA